MPSDGGSSDSGSGSGTSGGYGTGSGSGGGFSGYSGNAGGGGYTSYADPGESVTITPSPAPAPSISSQYAAYGEGRTIAESMTPDSGAVGIGESGGLSPNSSFGDWFSSVYNGVNPIKNAAVLLGPTPPLAKVQAAYSIYNSLDFDRLNIGLNKPRTAWNGEPIGNSSIYTGNSGSVFGSDTGFLSRTVSGSPNTSGQVSGSIDSSVNSISDSVDSTARNVYDTATDTVNSTEAKSAWSFSSIIATIAGIASIYGAFKQ